MRVPYVRTGYEAVLPYRLSEKFCYMAIADGVVIKKDEFSITIQYKDGTIKPVPIGIWTTKEEAGISYKHEVITDLVIGSKFKRGNTISYDKAFFEPDIFDPTRVIYKTGTSLKLSLMEVPETHEDSGSISYTASKKLNTNVLKYKSFIVNCKDDILDMVKINSKVEPNDVLFTITSPSLDGDDTVDEKTLEILQSIKNKSPKAKMRGTIHDIKIRYNCEFDELSDSLRKLTRISDNNVMGRSMKKGLTGKVNSSYSVKGRVLIDGDVEIKLLIDHVVGMGIGDKGIFSNQLKMTVGEVYEYDIVTENSNESVEAIFSTTSLAARIVNSPFIIGTTSTLLDIVRKNAVDMYFK